MANAKASRILYFCEKFSQVRENTFFAIAISLALFFNSCATVLSGTREAVQIKSNVEGTSVSIDGKDVGTTPLKKRLSRKHSHTVTLTKEGYTKETYLLQNTGVNGITYIGCPILIPLWIDMATGAIKKFNTKEINLTLVKIPQHISNSLPIACEKANFKIAAGATIGNVYYKSDIRQQIFWQNTVNVGVEELEVLVNNELSNFGFSTPAKAPDGNIENTSPKLLLEAEVRDMSYDEVSTSIWNYSIKTNCKLTVDWKLIRASNREVLFEKETIGQASRQEVGGSAVLLAAFNNALWSLLYEQKVYDLAAVPKMIASDPSSQIILTKAENNSTNSMEDVIKKSIGSVVTVETADGHGSGFIISTDGYIVTNYHVIEGTSKVNILFSNSFSFSGTVVRFNEKKDLALIKVDGSGFKPLTLSDAADLQIGSEVVAIGTPADKSFSQTVTKGIISGQRTIDGRNLIQTDVSISPGSSGGPLVDKNGYVIGVINSKIAGNNISGLGFAIPSSEIFPALNISYGK